MLYLLDDKVILFCIAVITIIGHIAIAYINHNKTKERELIKLAVETAHIDETKFINRDGEEATMPMSTNIIFYYAFFESLKKIMTLNHLLRRLSTKYKKQKKYYLILV